VVDETAPLHHAADSIIKGAQFDNNLLCIAEKETIVVEQIAEPFIAALKAAGAVELSGLQVDCLSAAAFQREANPAHCGEATRPSCDRKITTA